MPPSKYLLGICLSWAACCVTAFMPSAAHANNLGITYDCTIEENMGAYPVKLIRTKDWRDKFVFQTAFSKNLLSRQKRMVAFFAWRPGEDGMANPPLKIWIVPDPSETVRIDVHNSRIVRWPSKARLAKRASHVRNSETLGADMGRDVAGVIEVDAATLLAKYPDKAYLNLEIITPESQEKKRLWPRFEGRLNLQMVRQMLASEPQLNQTLAEKSGKASAACEKSIKVADRYTRPQESHYDNWNQCAVKIEESGVAAEASDRRITTRFMLGGTGKFTGIQISANFDRKIFDSKYSQTNWRHRIWADASVKDRRKNPLLVDIWSGALRYEAVNVTRFSSRLKWPELLALDATGEPINYRFAFKDGTEYLTGEAASGIFTRTEKLARKADIDYKSMLMDRVKNCDLDYPPMLI